MSRCRRRRVARYAAVVGSLVGGLAVAVGLAVAAPSADTATSLAKAGPPLVVNINTAPATIDPRDMTSFFDTIGKNFYVRLVDYGAKPGPYRTQQFDPNKIVPYLAKSWTVTDGGRTYTFKLKTGLKFPSGRPVDAFAVKYSIDRSLKGIGTYFLNDGIPGNLTSVEAPDAETFVFKLGQPDPSILQGWAQPAASILDQSVVEAQDDKWLGTHEAGSGPFRLVSYEPNKQMVIEPRPEYWSWVGKTPPASKITINFVNADTTLLLQARSGAADVTMGLSKRSVNSLRGNANVNIVTNPTTIQEQMLIPWDKPPFNNRKFRQAITYAVPYEQILDKIAYGYGKLFYGPLPPLMKFHNASLSQPVAFDLARAKALVKASGVRTPVPVKLTIDEGNTIHEQIATLLQGIWRQIGVNLTVQKLPPAEYVGAMFGFKVQSAIRYDGPGVIDAGYYLGYDMRCDVIGIGKNISLMCMRGADKLLDQARASLDNKVRQRNFDQVTKIWRFNAPKIVFYNDVATTVLSSKMKTFTYFHEPDFKTWGK